MKEINDTLMRALKRLDDDNLMGTNGAEEISRSNAISKAAQAVVNVVKTNLTIMQMSEQMKTKSEDIKKECGL